MKIYTIVGGIDGVGKSSFIGALKSLTTDLGVIIDTDEQAASCLDRGISFTQETTLNSGRISETVRKCKDAGYQIRLYYIALETAAESERRIANRVAHGGHDEGHEDVEQAYSVRWEALKRILPYCDEAELYDNENGFTQVAIYRNRELIPTGDGLPCWLRDFFNDLQPTN